MKTSQFKEYIKNEIIEILSEESVDDINAKKDAQAELNKELEKTQDLMKEDDDDDKEPSDKEINSKDSVAKIATKLSATNKEMKTVVNKWKKSEGDEKKEFLKRLKALTKIKKELEGLL